MRASRSRWRSAGLRPLLFEAERIGQASAGRSAGLLLPEPGPAFRDVQQHARAARVTDGLRDVAACGARRRSAAPAGEHQVRSSTPADSLHGGAVRGTSVHCGGRTRRERRPGSSPAGSRRSRCGRSPDSTRQAGLRLRGGVRRSTRIGPASAWRRGRRRKARETLRAHARRRRCDAAAKHVEIVVEGGIVRASTAIVTTGLATGGVQAAAPSLQAARTVSRAHRAVPAADAQAAVRRGRDAARYADAAPPAALDRRITACSSAVPIRTRRRRRVGRLSSSSAPAS